jgi:hypothetical protein
MTGMIREEKRSVTNLIHTQLDCGMRFRSMASFVGSVKRTITILVLIVLVFIAAADVQAVRRNLTRKT